MHRRHFLQALSALAAPGQAASRPNFVIICSDDQGIGDLGCFGARDMRTPHLDRLAASGIRFTDWHANAPVCSPSRASLLTGKYPHNAGIPEILFSKPNFDVPGLRKGERTLARELGSLGYRTGAIGKWHLGSTPESRPLAQGFDEFFGYYSGWIDYFSHRYYSLGGQPVYHDLWRNEGEVWEEPVYQTQLLTREAKAFLTRQKANRPFFLYLAYGAPHYPMMAPRSYLARFPESMDRDRRLHAAVIAALDDGIGEVLSALDSNGLRDTVVFFQSDNGATHELRADHRGRPYTGGSNGRYRGYKGSLFEGGMRVPAIMSWPGRIRAGQVVDKLCMAMDIVPTFLQWAGKREAEALDGLDLSETILRGAGSPRDTVFWSYKSQLAARRGEWKLIRDPIEHLNAEPSPREDWLVNLARDPGERENVARDNPAVLAGLRKGLERWVAALPSK